MCNGKNTQLEPNINNKTQNNKTNIKYSHTNKRKQKCKIQPKTPTTAPKDNT